MPASSCAKCGGSAAVVGALRPIARSFNLGSSRYYCSACSQQHHAREATKASIAIAVLVVISSLLILLGHQTTNLAWNLLLVYLMLVACIIPHELGHALGARLMGFRVFGIGLGVGTLIARFRIGGVPVELRVAPVAGHVRCATDRFENWRARAAVLLAAGPLANFLLFYAGLCFSGGWQELWSHDAWVHHFAWPQALAASNLMLLLGAITPGSLQTGMGRTPTDATQLLQALLGKPPDLGRLASSHDQLVCHDLMRHQRFHDIVAFTDRRLSQSPVDKDSLVFWRATGLICCRRYDDAIDAFGRIVADPTSADVPSRHGIALNNLAWALLMRRRPEDLATAASLSREAMNFAPSEACCRGTRGTALVLNGQAQEGLEFLQHALRTAEEPTNRATIASFMAIGYQRLGRADDAARWLAQARRWGATADGVEWAAAEIEGTAVMAPA